MNDYCDCLDDWDCQMDKYWCGCCLYCFCKLQRGNVFQVSYIPEKFAVVGKNLKLSSESGWIVRSAGKKPVRLPCRGWNVSTAPQEWKERDKLVRQVISDMDERYRCSNVARKNSSR